MKPTALLLLVAVAWASCGFAQPVSQQPAAAPSWHQTQKTDPAETYTFTRFTLEGKFLSSSQAPNHPALTVDCIPDAQSPRGRSKFLTASLLIGTPLKVLYVEPEEIRGTSYFPKVAVRYRIDNSGEDEQEKWALGTDRTPNPAPADKTAASIPRSALKKILRAHSVTVTANDEHGSPIQMQFNIPNAAPVEAACTLDE